MTNLSICFCIFNIYTEILLIHIYIYRIYLTNPKCLNTSPLYIYLSINIFLFLFLFLLLPFYLSISLSMYLCDYLYIFYNIVILIDALYLDTIQISTNNLPPVEKWYNSVMSIIKRIDNFQIILISNVLYLENLYLIIFMSF